MGRGDLQLAIIDLHVARPEYGATEIAAVVGCTDAYVRTVAQRCAIDLPRSPYGKVPSHGAAYCRAKRAKLLPVHVPGLHDWNERIAGQ